MKRVEELIDGLHELTKDFASPIRLGGRLATKIFSLDSTSQQTIIGVLVNAILFYAEIADMDEYNSEAVKLCKKIRKEVGVHIVLPYKN